MSELREEILEEEDTLETVAILDDASAVMMINRIKEANKQYEDMEAWYAFQLDKAKKIRDRTVEWAERSLRGYFDMVPAKVTKTQAKYELPGATLMLKAQQPKYEVDDPKLIEWIREHVKSHPESYIKVKETVNWKDFKAEMIHDGALQVCGDAVASNDGEIVPGIKVGHPAPVFQVLVK